VSRYDLKPGKGGGRFASSRYFEGFIGKEGGGPIKKKKVQGTLLPEGGAGTKLAFEGERGKGDKERHQGGLI